MAQLNRGPICQASIAKMACSLVSWDGFPDIFLQVRVYAALAVVRTPRTAPSLTGWTWTNNGRFLASSSYLSLARGLGQRACTEWVPYNTCCVDGLLTGKSSVYLGV